MVRFGRSVRCAVELCLAGVMLVPSPGWAQAAKGKKAAGGAVEIEEITVTAQRREESLQETPISVTALTGAALEQKGLSSMADIGTSVPGLRLNQTPNGNNSIVLTIRGIVQMNPESAFVPKVGEYVDGAYIAQVRNSNFDLEDLDRIEMLRGPQGTLYGRNATSGAVNFITKKPTEERAVTLQSSVGNYNTFKIRGTVNVPLIGKNGFFQSDALGTLSLRETAGYKGHDNIYTNGLTGSMPATPRPSGGSGWNNQNRAYNFTSLRWQPTKDFTADFLSEWHTFDNREIVNQLTYVYPTNKTVTNPLSPFYLIPYIQKNRSDVTPGSAMQGNDPSQVYMNGESSNERMYILTLAQELGELGPLGHVTLKSISNYRSYNINLRSQLSGSPTTIYESPTFAATSHWAEDLQWIGTAPRVRYVGGLYYFGEHDYNTTPQNIFGRVVRSPYFNFNRLKSYAVYGQGTWTPPILNDKLSLTAGLRFTKEQVQLDHRYGKAVAPTATVPGLHIQGGKAFGGFDGTGAPGISPMGSVAYQWTDEFMTYFSVSRGFAGGGFTPSTNGIAKLFKSFAPERLLSFEAGIKSQWLDNRLRFNASGYFMYYQDLQRNIFLTTGTGTAPISLPGNAQTAEMWGTETEVTAIPFRGLEATAGYSFIYPKYTKWLDQKFDPVTGAPVFDTNGHPVLINVGNTREFPFTPRHQLNGGLTYTAPPTSVGTLSVHLEVTWQDDMTFQPFDTTSPGWKAVQGWAYALANGRVSFAGIPLEKGSLDLAAYCNNLFDRKYRVYGIDLGSSLGFANNQYGDPRMFGLQLTYNFSES